MNGYIKLVLVFLVGVLLFLPMVITGPSGGPIMTLDDWVPDVIRGSGGLDVGVDAVKSLQESTEMSFSGGIFKWQDENGHWHFSNQQPIQTDSSVAIELSERENVIEASVTEGNNSSNIHPPDGFSHGQ